MKLGSYFIPYIKVTQNESKTFKTIKLSGGKTLVLKLYDIGFGSDFFWI